MEEQTNVVPMQERMEAEMKQRIEKVPGAKKLLEGLQARLPQRRATALAEANFDQTVKIGIGTMEKVNAGEVFGEDADGEVGYYVASVPKDQGVTPHVHEDGPEVYTGFEEEGGEMTLFDSKIEIVDGVKTVTGVTNVRTFHVGPESTVVVLPGEGHVYRNTNKTTNKTFGFAGKTTDLSTDRVIVSPEMLAA